MSSEHVEVLRRMRNEWPLATDEGPALDAAIASLSAPQPEGAEAVDFWVCPDCSHYYMAYGIVCDCHGRSSQKRMRHVRMAPVTSPPPPAEAHAQGGGEVWQQPDALPPVEPGKQGWFWVAVRRASNGRVYSFPATYLNAMKLMDENGDQEEFAGNRYHHGAVDEDEGTFLATGWHDVKEHSEFSGVYLPLLDSDKDELIAWRAVADYGDTAPPSAPVGVEAIRRMAEVMPPKPMPGDDYGFQMSPDHLRLLHERFAALAQQPAAVDGVKAYPLWEAIHAESAKAGHPCDVGLAQVIAALDAIAAQQGGA